MKIATSTTSFISVATEAKTAAIPMMIGLVTTPRAALLARYPTDDCSLPPSAVFVSTTTANRKQNSTYRPSQAAQQHAHEYVTTAKARVAMFRRSLNRLTW